MKGSLGVAREQALAVFGKAHTLPSVATDLQWFVTVEGVPAHVYYRRGEPELHISGLDVGAVARIRTLMLD